MFAAIEASLTETLPPLPPSSTDLNAVISTSPTAIMGPGSDTSDIISSLDG
ncbi:MAG: hypothetical protein LQ343_002404 [Gyalolechia ehrenbergii]|nr:MAG: hypothetical protein LQ343_002404 [Gyalolechia ehrenbergii]